MGVMGIRVMVSRSSSVRFVNTCNLPVHVPGSPTFECRVYYRGSILSTCNVDQFIQFTISSSSVKNLFYTLYVTYV
jgi:hypothetical protein